MRDLSSGTHILKSLISNKYIVLLSFLTILLIPFQNCSNGSFETVKNAEKLASTSGDKKSPVNDDDSYYDEEQDQQLPDDDMDNDMGDNSGGGAIDPPADVCDSSDSTNGTLAFPGALGFGKNSVGGRGGKILHVVNLNNSGTGSLRWALEDSSGPRIVVFDLEGQIRLTSQVRIKNPYITIAGQTAPGSGIVISGARVSVEAGEVIIRGLKSRAGDESKGDIPRNRDCISMGGNGDHGVKNVVLDHNSFTWGVDETLAVWGTIRDVTVSNNIVGQGLYDSIHVDEGATEAAPHSTGMIIGHGEDDPNSERVTIARNLFTSNKFRNPYLKGAEDVELVNNYMFNYGAGHQAVHLGGGVGKLTVSILDNYLEDGKDTPYDVRPPMDLRSLNSGSQIYLKNNYVQGHREGSGPETDVAHGKLSMVVTSPPFVAPSEKMSYKEVPSYVLNNVGARVQGQLDVVDTKIISQVKSKTIRIIDSPSEMGGYGQYDFRGRKVTDTDGDGIPNDVEEAWKAYGFDPNKADDKEDFDGDGYTNIEEYLNGLITGYSLNDCPKN